MCLCPERSTSTATATAIAAAAAPDSKSPRPPPFTDDVRIDKEALIQFILKCQDPAGGMSDRPSDERDLYHTYFGLAGLNMLGYLDRKGKVCRDPVVKSPRQHATPSRDSLYLSFSRTGIPSTPINSVYALPQTIVDQLGLPYQQL